MISRTLLALIAGSGLFIPLGADAQPSRACYPLTTDQITGRDLAAVIPEMAVLAPQAELGFAPAPGAQRLFRVAYLQQLASKYGIAAKIAAPVCFEWSMRPLAKDLMIAAMKKSLAGQAVEVEITDQAHALAPEGELSFPLSTFSGVSDKPAVWTGFVTYGGNRRFNTWAQVRITVHEKHILAVRPIAAGETIDAAALKTVDYEGPLLRVPALQNEQDVLGESARWSIAAGTVLTKNILVQPQDVEKEQLVTVRIDNGAAHIETQGVADDGGYRGNVIRVRNPKTGRVFRARIEERGIVTVVPGGPVGLVVEEKKS